MYENGVAESWLYGKLSSDMLLTVMIGGRIFNTIALANTVYPCVIYQWQGGHDVREVASYRIMVDSLYLVKGIARSTRFEDAKKVYDRVDLLIHGSSGTVESGTVYACVREQPIQLAEQDGDVQYRHWGGIYRIWYKGVPNTA